MMITPLGSDVDPLVNWRKAGESEDDDDDESDDAGSGDAGVLSLSQAAAAKDSDDREAIIYLFAEGASSDWTSPSHGPPSHP